MLSLENVTKQFKLGPISVPALNGVSLQVAAGETVVLTGRSGAGKSTLLHIAGLIDEPSSGSVSFNGVDLGSLSDDQRSDFRRDTFGFVFQSYHLVPVLTVLENVTLPAKFRGTPTKAANARGRALLKEVGLEGMETRKAKHLSGGQRQRVAIARALVNEPKLVFADEPTANLDAENGARVMDLLSTLCERHGVGLLIATHDASVVARAHRQVVMRDGKELN